MLALTIANFAEKLIEAQRGARAFVRFGNFKEKTTMTSLRAQNIRTTIGLVKASVL